VVSGVAVFVGSAVVAFAVVGIVPPEGSCVVETISAVLETFNFGAGLNLIGVPSLTLDADELDVV